MHPAIYGQGDDPSVRDQVSMENGTEGGGEMITRQDKFHETEISYILRNHGINPDRPARFGEVDFSVDLQQAYALTRQAKQAYDRLPDELKAKYANWEEILLADANGTLAQAMQDADLPNPFNKDGTWPTEHEASNSGTTNTQESAPAGSSAAPEPKPKP